VSSSLSGDRQASASSGLLPVLLSRIT